MNKWFWLDDGVGLQEQRKRTLQNGLLLFLRQHFSKSFPTKHQTQKDIEPNSNENEG